MNKIQSHIKELVAKSPDIAINKLLEIIKVFQIEKTTSNLNEEYDALIMTKGQFLSATHEYNNGLIRRDERDISIQKVRHSLIYTINNLPHEIFNLSNFQEILFWEDKLEKDEVSIKATDIVKNSNFEYDIFFSFSSQNLPEAQKVVSRLRGYGLRVFFSDETLKEKVGESFSSVISNAIENSSHFLWLCTPESSESPWARLEVETFFSQIYLKDPKRRRFYILRGSGFEIQLVPLLYRNLQFADEVENVIIQLPFLPLNNSEKSKKEADRKSQEKSILKAQEEERKRLESESLHLEKEKKEIDRKVQEEEAKQFESERFRLEKEKEDVNKKVQEEAIFKAKKEERKRLESENLRLEKEKEKNEHIGNKPSNEINYGPGNRSFDEILAQFGDIYADENPFKEYFSEKEINEKTKNDPSKSKNKRIKLLLNENEMKQGVNKKIKILKQNKCLNCLGFGSNSTTCSMCKGAGYVRELRNTFLGQMATTAQCKTCDGIGHLSKECQNCQGEGRIFGESVMEIIIPPNVNEGNELILVGLGDFGIRGEGSGNLLVRIEKK